MHKLRLTAVATALVASGALATTADSASKTIRVKDDVFSPKSTTVSRNTTVKFRWVGRKPHNVVVTRGPAKFQFATRTSGTRSRKMSRRGRYTLVCTLHSGMTMKLRVR